MGPWWSLSNNPGDYMDNFIELTRPDDSRVCVARAWIQAFHVAPSRKYAGLAKTEMILSGDTIGVKEDYITIRFQLAGF